ncbi:CYTOCHROME P450 71B37-LIKE [Salix koriyanagi]|uniref:CYTOCHROME P450 71B37-LIKE n=1 Tax=Salix koriyanagi TaxID=2511006 RepID=A0A9Q1AN31_9ROSI|nr:CYTOCHROME P450 71B37-LIKE [Salix koriyanagi]
METLQEICSCRASKEVLKSIDLHGCSRPLLAGTGRLSYTYSDVSFTPYGDYWRKMPKICVLELFSARRVQSFLFISEEEGSFWKEFSRNQRARWKKI